MELADLVSLDGIIAASNATSKKQALQQLSRRAAEVTGIAEGTIFDTLLERERLGTTGIGAGIAIPHGKLNSIDRLYGLFARLQNAIDFDSLDDRPVDLIFLLLAPETAGADHLKALARVSRLMRDEKVCQQLRQCDNATAILSLITQPSTPHAA